MSDLRLGAATSPSRVMFGPLVTNLGDDDRRLTDRHVAFYARRARGGCGVVVVEGASVHPLDWPYERAPLAERCADGWAAIADACRPHGALVIASLDHAGGQGSSAYSQRELWAPGRVPEVNSREVPKSMESDDVDAVIAGFAAAAQLAIAAGCDGVEVNAGQHSLVRQFLSGLTNPRTDVWGIDRTTFAREVLRAVRAAVGSAVVGLRLCVDELAPWAGITPDQAPDLATTLANEGVDYVVPVRGSIYTASATRPDFHEPTAVNSDVCRAVHQRLTVDAPDVAVFLQGSVVDPLAAERAIGDGVCDAVEMTRAQLADPDLVTHVRAGDAARVRPCLRCNQTCQVRDPRNPIVTCVTEPSTGHELDDPDWYEPAAIARDVLVIGAGPAGLETARVAARRGHRVRVVDRSPVPGGTATLAGPGRPLVDWLTAECRHAGIELETTTEGGAAIAAASPGTVVVQCTGSRRGATTYDISPDAIPVIDVVDVVGRAAAHPLPEGIVAILDPIGGPIAVELAESLGARAVLVTPDQIAGNELSRSGDLAPANGRLQRAGVRIERRAVVRAVTEVGVIADDRFTGERRIIPAAAVIDCGFRLPSAPLPGAHHAAGDCVAPRTLLEAVLEGRRVARAL
ncbi:MAG: mycofactocin system FadH/OYE family oxidoreductase 1 [Ilumatobacteraceae bacterium]